MKLLAVLGAAMLASAAAEAPALRLTPLPCTQGPLQPVDRRYCRDHRHYVTPPAHAVLTAVAGAVASRHPGAVVRYMEASWPAGRRPMPPHLSHGDGRQIDLALFYQDLAGRPLKRPPQPTYRVAPGYGAFEPPRHESERVCTADSKHHAKPDPPKDRRWRLDEARTAALVRELSADARVRSIFLEPHLKRRLGFANDPKVRFAGCQAARHDDHVHVDFY